MYLYNTLKVKVNFGLPPWKVESRSLEKHTNSFSGTSRYNSGLDLDIVWVIVY